MYTKEKVNRVTLNLYNSSPYWDEVEAQYEVGLNGTGAPGVVEGRRLRKSQFIEVIHHDVAKVDLPAPALVIEGQSSRNANTEAAAERVTATPSSSGEGVLPTFVAAGAEGNPPLT